MDQDWDAVLRRFVGNRTRHTIDGREHAGTAYPIDVPHEWSDALDVSHIARAVPRQNQNVTHGIVLASGKDFVPNQENKSSGAQKAMQLDGDDWEPVDNLFVWFLPFANMFGVLAESVSASRAATFADWLTRATAADMSDPDFAWLARPVIDQAQLARLASAHGLRAVNYAGEFGTAVNDASGVRALFRGPNRAPGALRIEIKATLVRGKSTHGDEEIMLQWFNDNFGALQGQVEKAQVTVAQADTPAAEVDLLHHRLTRKTQVRIATGATRAFTPLSAVGSIIEAFVIDKDDLVRLRASDD
ncbi:hypothetical protein ACFM35_00890 [Microbacterium sp. P01]|uniref:hypothetical protein n=1 Tax=Microbacterium sp. P01 TaxID=3366261 RepID=UPI00366C0A06